MSVKRSKFRTDGDGRIILKRKDTKTKVPIFNKNIRFNQWFIWFAVLMLLISSLNAAIYVSLNTEAELSISDDIEALQFMAVDWNHEGERVLQREGDRFKLNLGTWPLGENKTYPAAFAIVNPSGREFTVTDISLRGDPGNLRMHLHRNMTRPCNEEMVDIEKTEKEEHKEIIYNQGIGVDKEGDPIDFEWGLAEGKSMDEDTLTYLNRTKEGTAEKEDGLWVHDSDGPVEAEEGEANFVWVEMAVFSKTEEEEQFRGPLEFEIDGEFEPEPEPNVAFMGAGRRNGGPVIRALEGNTIELNLTDLDENRTVVIPDAFAIVNTGPTELKVDDIKVEDDEEDHMRVWLHSDPDQPAGDYDLGVDRDEEREPYYDGENTGPGDPWTLSEGFGHTEEGNVIYGHQDGNGEDTSYATRTAGHPEDEYNLWMYDEEADNVAEQENSNFVWVEVAYVVEELPEESIDVHADITFQFSSA